MSDNGDGRAAVLVDIDGTLVDTNYLHTLAWWRAFREVGIELPMVRFHRLIGMGSDHIIKELLGREEKGLSEAHTSQYQPMRAELVRLPGARELLHDLAGRGARVILATSAKEDDLDALRATLDADDVIDSVTTSSEVEKSKPDPDIFINAMEGAGMEPEGTICLGDTVWDVKAARGAGLDCVCVLTGGNPEQELLDAGAVGVYRDCAHLLEELDDSPIGALLR